MRVAHVGSYEHWRVGNATEELHPMHIHQVHSLRLRRIGIRSRLTDRVIRGMSLFHCYLLNHEDKGMMAKILFE